MVDLALHTLGALVEKVECRFPCGDYERRMWQCVDGEYRIRVSRRIRDSSGRETEVHECTGPTLASALRNLLEATDD